MFLTFSVKTFYGVSLISWKKWIWNDTLNLLKFVIWFQKQISCFVEYKNDKERKMAKGKSWVEINCKQRIKKQIAIKVENLRGSMTAVQWCFRAAVQLMWDSSPAVESSSILQVTVSPGWKIRMLDGKIIMEEWRFWRQEMKGKTKTPA